MNIYKMIKIGETQVAIEARIKEHIQKVVRA